MMEPKELHEMEGEATVASSNDDGKDVNAAAIPAAAVTTTTDNNDKQEEESTDNDLDSNGIKSPSDIEIRNTANDVPDHLSIYKVKKPGVGRDRWIIRNMFWNMTLPQWAHLLWMLRGSLIDGMDIISEEGFKLIISLFFITLNSMFTSLCALIEDIFVWWPLWLFDRCNYAKRINPRPIFIIGHYRSGTTLLHNSLIECGKEHLTFTSGTQVVFPNSFLLHSLMVYVYQLLGCIPGKRPFDDVPIKMSGPQEDEVAICTLSGGMSPFARFFLMHPKQGFLLDFAHFRNVASGGVHGGGVPPTYAEKDKKAAALLGKAKKSSRKFGTAVTAAEPASAGEDITDDAEVEIAIENPMAQQDGDIEAQTPSEDGKLSSSSSSGGGGDGDGEEFLGPSGSDILQTRAGRRWKNAMLTFLWKVSWMRGKEKRLVLKSPAHTSRIPLLLEMFPDAKFVFIHRHPYEVWRSTANMLEKTNTSMGVGHIPNPQESHEFVRDQYSTLMREYMRTRQLVPKENLLEVRYENLVDDPKAVVSEIYEQELEVLHETPSSKRRNRKKGGDAKQIEKEAEKREKRMEKFCAKKHQNFSKNNFGNISEETRDLLYNEWKDIFEEFGYSR